jgi:ABC-type cobalamin/Fe3+-siderophores transport system ATPase subunit
MAYIVECRIEGLAGRTSEYNVKFNRDANIFFGLNGSGKTSLLRILYSAMQNDPSTLEHVPFRRAEVQIYSVDWKRVFTRTLERPIDAIEIAASQSSENTVDAVVAQLRFLAKETNARSLSWTTTPTLSKKEQTKVQATSRIRRVGGPGAFSCEYLPTSRLYSGIVGISRYGEENPASVWRLSEDRLDLAFAESVQDLWRNYSGTILTEVRQAQEEGLASILRAILTPREDRKTAGELDSHAAYSRVQAFLRRQGTPRILGPFETFERRYRAEPELQSVVSDIDEVERRIEKAMAPRSELQNLISRMFSGNKQVHFEDASIDVETSDNHPIGLNTLSSGEKHLLRILIGTLAAKSGLVIVDEPEISLHIDWQKDLVSAMRTLNPDAQLILATHSPEIMADVDDSRVFRL